MGKGRSASAGPGPDDDEGITDILAGAAGMAPGLVAAMCGPLGFNGVGAGAGFAQDAAAEVLPPGPVLAAMTEAAVTDVGRLTDDQLIGVLRAARRQENREAWKKALVIAEFARRRAAEFEAARARGVPVHCRPGQFPGEELAVELVTGPVQASHAVDDATDLATRLPATLAGMAAGLIDEARAGVIALHTRCLSPADAAHADAVLATLAPALRLEQLARKAAALEMKLNPEAVRARREHARRTRQRVEVFREESGNAAVAGREMTAADALASKAHVHTLALRLRRAGAPGTLDQLRLRVFADLTAGRDPLEQHAARQAAPPQPAPQSPDAPQSPATPAPPVAPEGRVSPATPIALGTPITPQSPATPVAPDVPATPVTPEGPVTPENPAAPGNQVTPERPAGSEGPDAPGGSPGSPSLDYDHDDHNDHGDLYIPGPGGTPPPSPPAAGTPPAPVPAMINLVVHAGTLFGWDTTPTEAGGWGLLDADETRAVVAAASTHPATRWCVTVTGADGTALAHGCSPGHHPWTPASPASPASQGSPSGHSSQSSLSSHSGHSSPSSHNSRSSQPGAGPPDRAGPQPPPAPQAAQLAGFLRRLNATLTPVAQRTCDHAQAEPGYTPSRKLKHLVRARSATCDAPGCPAQAAHADLDHTTPHPDGPTDQCNLSPKCRRHHKAKQAPGWKAEQPSPAVTRWTLPSGRTHTTTSTVYDITLAANRTTVDPPAPACEIRYTDPSH